MKLNLRNVTARGQRVTITGKFGDRKRRTSGTKTIGPDGDRRVHRHDPDRQAAAVVAAGPEPLRRLASPSASTAKKVAGYSAAQRDPLDQGLQRAPVPQRRSCMNIRGVGLHEDSKAQGFAIDNARREQLVNARQGARRDRAAHALPAAPVHARARGPARPADLVGDPGLQRQDRGAQGAGGAAAGGRGARAGTSTPTRTTRR